MRTVATGQGTAQPAAAPAAGWRRRLRRLARDRSAVVGAAIVVVLLAAALLAPWLAPHDPIRVNFTERFASSSRDHLLGTDNLGRDVLSRLLYGARLSIGMAVTATAGMTLLGLMLGLIAGYAGGSVDGLIMRAVDVLMALPTFILALVVVGLLGQGLRNLVVTIILVGWADYARVVRGATLSLRERDFVEAARAAGASNIHILSRAIVPNLLGPVVVLSTVDLGRTLLVVSGLSFLGMGVEPPTPEWGAMLAEAKGYLDRAPQLLIYPGLAITLLVLGFNLAGDGLRDWLDPRMRR